VGTEPFLANCKQSSNKLRKPSKRAMYRVLMIVHDGQIVVADNVRLGCDHQVEILPEHRFDVVPVDRDEGVAI